jgi:hypothetical protein
MTKPKKTEDPCSKCPLVGKRTKEGNLYCRYCNFKLQHLAATEHVIGNLLFYDGKKTIHNKLQMWTTQPYRCRKCRLGQFKVEVEVRDESKRDGADFACPPQKRMRIICCNCNAEYLPEEVITE